MPGPLATEITVTGRSGDRCVIRMVHSLFTEKDDWDDELEGFESGWPGFFEVLRVYLAHFAGQPAAIMHAAASRHGDEAEVWSALTASLSLAGANAGERRVSPGRCAANLAGVVRARPSGFELAALMVRLDEPGERYRGDRQLPARRRVARASASIYFYGPNAADTAAARTDEMVAVAAWRPRRRTRRALAWAGAPTAGPPVRGSALSCRGARRPRRVHSVVRPLGRQRHPGDFRCRRWWFVGEDRRLGAHRGRLAAGRASAFLRSSAPTAWPRKPMTAR